MRAGHTLVGDAKNTLDDMVVSSSGADILQLTFRLAVEALLETGHILPNHLAHSFNHAGTATPTSTLCILTKSEMARSRKQDNVHSKLHLLSSCENAADRTANRRWDASWSDTVDVYSALFFDDNWSGEEVLHHAHL